MSLLSRVFKIQIQDNGFESISHNNILLASPENRKRLIFYFIANRTPQKIDQEDHSLFHQRKSVIYILDFVKLLDFEK
jgi:hypothetical protein